MLLAGGSGSGWIWQRDFRAGYSRKLGQPAGNATETVLAKRLADEVPSMNIKLIEKKNNSNISRESGICQLCDSLRESEEKG